MWGIPELVQKISEAFQKFTGAWDQVAAFFDPEFFGMIGFTGVVVGGALLVSHFFPVLRPVAGAAVVGVAARWYGYSEGRASRQKEIDKLKAQAKAKKPVPTPPARDPWKW